MLVLLLACSAQAGYIPNGSPTPPPASPSSAEEEPTDDATLSGEMGTPGVISTPSVSGSLTQTALDLLALLPSLL